jgi:epoxyqueuosine reductase
LTIEHKGPIPLEFRKAIGNRIYGCDDCLAVCPWNKFAQPTSHRQLVGRKDLSAPLLSDLSALNEKQFRAIFAGSPIKRIGRNRFVRNVLIAIGNSNDRSLLPSALALQQDFDPVVAEAADWAADQLSS